MRQNDLHCFLHLCERLGMVEKNLTFTKGEFWFESVTVDD